MLMIDDRYLELMNKEIDGELSSEEKRELEAYLAEHPEARRLYEQLEGLPQLLAQVKQLEPPSGLTADVLSAVDKDRYRGGRVHRLGRIPALIVAKLDIKYAYSFAAGLLVGVAVYVLTLAGTTRVDHLDPSDLSGTILLGKSSAETKVLDSFAIEGEGISGRLQAGLVRGLLLVQLTLSSEREATVSFGFDQRQISFQGFRVRSGQPADLRCSDHDVRLSHMADGEYHLIFGSSSNFMTEIRFEVYMDELLFERAINLRGGDN